MPVSSVSICAICKEGRSWYNAVILPCGHVSCANCVVNSQSGGLIECSKCQEAIDHRNSQPRARQIFVEPEGNAHLQAQITALESSLDEEKRSRKEFESELLRQLLKISIKEEEKNRREVETLRVEIGVTKNSISIYRQELDQMRTKLAAVERLCVGLENEMKATKVRGDTRISRLEEALKQEKQRANGRHPDEPPAMSTSKDVKAEEISRTIDARRTAPHGARASSPAIKNEKSQVAPKLADRDIAVESRQAVATDGRRGRVFRPAAPTNIFGSDTDTDKDAETGLGVEPSERSILPLPTRKAPVVNLPASLLGNISSVPITPAPTNPEAATPPKKPELKRGAEIKWRGYGCPQNTAVPECSDKSGVHNFSGSGTNQYMRKYTCRGCGFSCSERWQR